MSGEKDIISNDFGYTYLKKNKIISVYNTDLLAIEIFDGMKKQMSDFKKSKDDIMDAIDEAFPKGKIGELSGEAIEDKYHEIVSERYDKKDKLKSKILKASRQVDKSKIISDIIKEETQVK